MDPSFRKSSKIVWRGANSLSYQQSYTDQKDFDKYMNYCFFISKKIVNYWLGWI